MKREININGKSKSNVIFILLAALLFLISLYKSMSIWNLPDTRLNSTGLIPFSKEWYTVKASGERTDIVDLSTWKTRASVPTTIYKTFPDLTAYDCLFIEINYNYMKVYADDLCIYDYSEEALDIPSKMTGHFIAQIPLDTDMSGKTISIEFYQPNSVLYTGINSISIGTGSAFITDYVSSHMELIISLFIIHFIGICLFAVYVWQKPRKIGEKADLLRSLALFILITGIWMFTDSQLPQLLWHNSITVCVLSFFCFMAFPIPLFTFVSILCPDSHRTLITLRYLLLSNIVAQGALYATGIFSFVQMLPVTHVLNAISVIVLFIYLSQHYLKKKSTYAKLILLALIFLLISGVFSLVRFYFSRQIDNSRYFRYGFLIFIAFLVYISAKAMLDFMKEYTEHKIMKNLAFTDFLTGAESRLAFEEYMAEIRNRTDARPLTLYVFDLNNLKTINDAYGHNAGDIILKEACSCIKKIYLEQGRVFRFGGDEFVAAVQLPVNELPDLCKQLEQEILNANTTCEYPFTLSMGCASAMAVQGNSVDLLFKDADLEMYKMKNEFRSRTDKS